MKHIIIAVLSLLTSSPLTALAVQTQVNEVTDLFDKHIEDKDSLLQEMKMQNDNAMDQIKSRNCHDSIEGMDGAEGKANELNSIKESDLDDTGRRKRVSEEYQFYDENELEPDYTKPGNRMHKLDADEIVTSVERDMRKLGTDLMNQLIELGFNCKTVKGAIHKEPTYYIEIKREEQKNTEYDQFFCEEPKNQYNCNDSLALRCVKRGISEIKHIAVPIDEIPSYWFKDNSSLGTLVNSWGKSLDSANHSNEISNFIKSKIGKNDIIIPHQKIDMVMILAMYSIKYKDIDHSYYQPANTDGMHNGKIKIRFHYIEGDSGLCLEWSEDWNERCMLK